MAVQEAQSGTYITTFTDDTYDVQRQDSQGQTVTIQRQVSVRTVFDSNHVNGITIYYEPAGDNREFTQTARKRCHNKIASAIKAIFQTPSEENGAL